MFHSDQAHKIANTIHIGKKCSQVIQLIKQILLLINHHAFNRISQLGTILNLFKKTMKLEIKNKWIGMINNLKYQAMKRQVHLERNNSK